MKTSHLTFSSERSPPPPPTEFGNDACFDLLPIEIHSLIFDRLVDANLFYSVCVVDEDGTRKHVPFPLHHTDDMYTKLETFFATLDASLAYVFTCKNAYASKFSTPKARYSVIFELGKRCFLSISEKMGQDRVRDSFNLSWCVPKVAQRTQPLFFLANEKKTKRGKESSPEKKRKVEQKQKPTEKKKDGNCIESHLITDLLCALVDQWELLHDVCQAPRQPIKGSRGRMGDNRPGYKVGVREYVDMTWTCTRSIDPQRQ